MNVVYLFFKHENVHIPFSNFDSTLVNSLIKSRLGLWDPLAPQYILKRANYDRNKLARLFAGKPFVEVSGDNPGSVNIYGFLHHSESVETAESPNNAVIWENTYFAPGMYSSLQDLGDIYFQPWAEKLEAELSVRKYSQNTRKAYIYYNQTLCQWLQKSPDEVTSEDIKQYLAFKEKTEGLATSSINLALSAFKFFYRHIVKTDTAKESHRPRQDKRLPVVLSKMEVKNLLESEGNQKHRLLLMMVYASGLRVSEAVCLKRQDVDINRRLIMVAHSKGRKDRYTVLSDIVIKNLKEYYGSNNIKTWLFPGADPSKHLSIRSAQYIFVNAHRKAGIDKNTSIHSLRHTFATHLLENGTDIRYIQELLGHSSLRTTERYTHIARRSTLKIQSPLDSIDTDE